MRLDEVMLSARIIQRYRDRDPKVGEATFEEMDMEKECAGCYMMRPLAEFYRLPNTGKRKNICKFCLMGGT